MANQALTFPVAGIREWQKEKDSDCRKSLFDRLLKWYRSGDGIVQRLYSSKFSQIADPMTGTYMRIC